VAGYKGDPHFTPTGPVKMPFQGTHFSDQPISGGVLRGSMRGASGAEESARLDVPPQAPAGVHVVRQGHLAHPHLRLRKYSSGVSGNKAIADVEGAQHELWNTSVQQGHAAALQNGLDPKTAQLSALNAGEHGIKAAGYDGMEFGRSAPGSVLMFGDVAVDKSHV